MILRGRAHRFGDDINTDYIISSKYKAQTLRIEDAAKHLMEDIDPGFAERIAPGDIIVAGRNFGCGSSREAAPRVIKAAGIAAVVASSFARIFFRNSINIGLPVLACDTQDIGNGDEIEIDLAAGRVRNLSTGGSKTVQPLPKVMMNVIADGGLVQHIRKHGTYMLD
jgi:3-isopropylmalate/(R)-2-methylmalate dehydratase small subunit